MPSACNLAHLLAQHSSAAAALAPGGNSTGAQMALAVLRAAQQLAPSDARLSSMAAELEPRFADARQAG